MEDHSEPDFGPLPTTPEERAAYIKAAQATPKGFGPLCRLFEAELRAHPAFAETMAPYYAGSHAHVVTLYANVKAGAYLKGPVLLQEDGRHFVALRDAAARELWVIQQKKLFDLQCRWRAEELTLPGLRHSEQFRQWENYPDHCPWLPPVTEDEVALYAAYLRSDHYVPTRNWMWQDYATFQRAEAEGESDHDDDDDAAENDDARFDADERRAYHTLPAWYQYYNAHTGTNLLRDLPDRRGEKEQYYINLTEADKAAKLAAQRARGDMAASLPWHPLILGGFDADLSAYFRLYEPPAELPRLLRWHTADRARSQRRNGYFFEATDWIAQALEHQTTPWPIEAHADWRRAVIATAHRAWGHQLADVLLEVWHEQEQNRALGLPVTGPQRNDQRVPFEEVNWDEEETYRPKFILHGRELAGEPRDFNF